MQLPLFLQADRRAIGRRAYQGDAQVRLRSLQQLHLRLLVPLD